MKRLVQGVAGVGALVAGVKAEPPPLSVDKPQTITFRLRESDVVNAFMRDYKKNGKTRQVIKNDL